MSANNTRVTAVIFVILFILSATAGCTLFNESDEEEEKRERFTLESLSDTVPTTNSYSQPTIELKPELNTSIPGPVQKFIANWYFEKNVVYTYYGGILKASIQNNGSDRMYVHRLGFKPSWSVEGYEPVTDDGVVYVDVGKYVNSSEKEYIGILYFPGPATSGTYEYSLVFSMYTENTTGAWNDNGDQEGTAKTFEVIDLPEASKYKQHYNLPQYYDRINDIVNPTSDEVITLSRKLAGEYSGPFNIYQICAIFDYISANIKYLSDPSSTENYWCTPEQTLELGGDCEDFSTLIASLLISIGGSVRMYLTDSHAFVGVYLGNESNIDSLTMAIQNYYHTNVFLYWFKDELGVWLILDTIGAIYPGGLPLGAAPIMKSYGDTSSNYYWTWDFTETETLYIVDIIPKK
ncbi:MAG: transglutaminase domain-containing protein [Thermoplasmata archaeon]|nr:transglutaminase domain-containing protein [Thermoplasmata archaeon]